MKTKSFQSYIEKRLSKSEIAEIRRQARLEKKALDFKIRKQMIEQIETELDVKKKCIL